MQLMPVQIQLAFTNKLQCVEYVNKLPSLLIMQGYAAASVDTVYEDSTTVFIQLFVGKKYDWKKINDERFEKFGYRIQEGFVGNTVLMKKSAIEKTGLWDERIQAADFDLYIRSKKRNLSFQEIQNQSEKAIHVLAYY